MMAGEMMADEPMEDHVVSLDNPYGDYTNEALVDVISRWGDVEQAFRSELRRRLLDAPKSDGGPEPARMSDAERLSAMGLFGSLMGMVAVLRVECDLDTAQLIERAIRNG